jgi:hypothetical protein
MTRTLSQLVANVSAEQRAKITAAHRQKLIAEEQKRIVEKRWLLGEARRVVELDRNLIAIAVIITALPIIAALFSDILLALYLFRMSPSDCGFAPR